MRYHILNLFSQNQYYLSPHVLLLSKHVKNRNQKLKWTLTFKIPHGTTTRARKLSRLLSLSQCYNDSRVKIHSPKLMKIGIHYFRAVYDGCFERN